MNWQEAIFIGISELDIHTSTLKYAIKMRQTEKKNTRAQRERFSFNMEKKYDGILILLKEICGTTIELYCWNKLVLDDEVESIEWRIDSTMMTLFDLKLDKRMDNCDLIKRIVERIIIDSNS